MPKLGKSNVMNNRMKKIVVTGGSDFSETDWEGRISVRVQRSHRVWALR